MSEDNSNKKNIEDRLVELEARLLEQEHRPIKLIWNFWNRKKYSNQNDKRRKAVSKALLFRFFFSPTTLAIAGTGIISFFTIYFMFRQTQLFEKQNKLFEFQNTRIEEQNQLSEASRRSSQMFIMGEVLSDINKELENKSNKNKTFSDGLVARIITLSRAMKPYKYLENNKLTEKALSPERGQLLIALHESNVDRKFLSNRLLSKCDFSFAYLKGANLKNAILNNINLKGADLTSANLEYCNIKNSILDSTNLSYVNLNNTNLSYSTFIGASMNRTKLSKSILNNSLIEIDNFIFSGLTIQDSRIVMDNKTKLDSVILYKNFPYDVKPNGFSSKRYKKQLLSKENVLKKNYPNYNFEIHSVLYSINNIIQFRFELKMIKKQG